MKTIQEKAKEYALKRYPITDPYDQHLPIADERGNVEEAFEDGAKFGFDLAIEKLIEIKNEYIDKTENAVFSEKTVCPVCGGYGFFWLPELNEFGGWTCKECETCNGVGYITI